MLLLVSALGWALFAVSAAGSISQRIVQGELAEPEEFPYQLSLQVRGRHICGAVAIEKNVVLTAAHCVDLEDIQTWEYTFVCGLNDIHGQDGQVAFATKIMKHEGWKPSGFGFPNDIAVIFVDPPFRNDTSSCQFARLPPNNDKDYANKDSIISGWGRLSGNGVFPTRLKKAHIPTINNTECGEDYDIFGFIKVIHDFHICVKDPKKQQGACNGDSGGPLTTLDLTTGNVKVIGLTSFGKAGCDTTVGSVYTRISYYVDWIQKQKKALRA